MTCMLRVTRSCMLHVLRVNLYPRSPPTKYNYNDVYQCSFNDKINAWYSIPCRRESVKETILVVPTAQPCIIVRGQLDQIEAVLVIEKKLVTTFNPKEAPLLLLGAFYTFNMHYTEGCSNFYTFFEVVFLNKKKPSKMTRLSGIIARLSSCREL